MRIERVVAHAFGPFTAEALDLAEGMTVVVGPNEAGKSSWHAAIRAAVCGVRRARGRATTEDALFERRHRPWDGEGTWLVEARLALDDGRTIEMSQDLAGKVACRATDVVLGRDVSSEIIVEGMPDASRWLGLDRDAFAATICVSQAQITAIADRDTAAALQEHMQRAAATRGTDATAAEARERLALFRRNRVGVDRAGARGPLRASLAREADAQEALAEARRRHAEFLQAGVEAEAAIRAADEAARRVAFGEAAVARRLADAAQRRARRAAELAARHPTAPEPIAERDLRADAVARAIEAWERRPRTEPLAGARSAELERRLGAIPPEPAGDLEIHPSVALARRALDAASDALGLQEPRPAADATSLDGPTEDVLRSLARRLRTPFPDEARLVAGEAIGRGAVLSQRHWTSGAWLAVAGAAPAAGVLLAVAGQPTVGLGMVLLGAALAAVAWWRAGVARRERADRAALAEAALLPLRAARQYARDERAAARAEAEASGLPPDADLLEQLAERRAAAQRGAAALEAWHRQRALLDERRSRAETALLEAIRARDPTLPDGPPESLLAAYETGCRRRTEQARLAAQRDALLQALDARRTEEKRAAEAALAVAGAEAALREAATSIGITVEDASQESLAAALTGWQTARATELQSVDEAMAEWHELGALLDGISLADLRAEAEDRSRRAAELEDALGAEEVRSLARRQDLETLVAVEREDLVRARSDADSRGGALEQMRLELPDVSEAEEALAEAAAERARVIGLAHVLDETLVLLRSAEELVHRDLAPILAAALRRWLAWVSGGAYVDASVDPADLSVQVKEAATGRWRPALLLSEGTREQVYLLLRVAMAQHLVTTAETALLLLDEVTAQADPNRTQRLLDVLHQLSAERQVILFSHDPEVAAWAERSFDSGRDRLVLLPALPAQAGAAVVGIPA